MIVYYLTWLSVLLFSNLIALSDTPEKEKKEVLFFHNRKAKFCYILILLILCFVAGLRYNVGADFFNYYYVYSDGIEGVISRLKDLNEPGIYFLYWISQLIVPKSWFSILFISSVIISIYLIVIYNNSFDLKTTILLFMFVIWHTSFNGVRQVLAAAILFTSIKYLRKQEFIKYCFVVFIAFLFHKSAIVMLPIYILAKMKVNIQNVLLLSIVTIIATYSYDRIVQFTGYILENSEYLDAFTYGGTNYISRNVNVLRILFEVAPAIIFLVIYSPVNKDKDTELYLNLLIIHAVIAIVTSFSAYLARMNLYTMPFAIVSISNLLSKLKTKNKYLLKTIFVIMFALFGWYEIYHSVSYSNFQFCWSVIS